MRRLRLLISVPLLAVPLQLGAAMTAQADPLDAGTVECSVTGALSTNAGVVPETVTFTANLAVNCAGVVLDDVGIWQMVMSGQMSPGFCAGGQGLATVTVNGPDGGGQSGVRLTLTGTTLTIAGVLNTSDGGGDAFKASLQAIPTSGIPCVNTVTQENLSGEASITDLEPPPDFVVCTGNGSEGYAPGLLPAAEIVNINGTANLTCTNPVSDDRGAWTVTYNGNALADCGLGEGMLGLGFTAPDGSGSGSADYERVGTMLNIVGTSGDNDLDIWAQVTDFSGTCVTTPFFGANYTGVAGIIE